MRAFLALLEQFRSDERGSFIVIFGILAIVLVATAGAVIDFTTLQQARSRAQDALDVAVLGLQPRIFDDPAPTQGELAELAEALLNETLANENITATVNSATFDEADGTLRLDASIDVPMAFVRLVGVSNITASVVSEATRKQLYVEVAMVLDNSGSMAQQSRMSNLKAAATCATNILFNGDCYSTATEATVDNVKIGIVPFTEFVNVKTWTGTPPFWIDTAGTSDVSKDNFDNDSDDSTPISGTAPRLNLYNAIGVTWKGCVEARNHVEIEEGDGLYYDTADLPPNSSIPDSLFVPTFAPDNPGEADSGGWGGWGSDYSNSYLDDDPAACKPPPKYIVTRVRKKCDDDVVGTVEPGEWSWLPQAFNNLDCDGTQPADTYQTISVDNVASTATSTRPASLSTDPGTNPDPGANNYSEEYQSSWASGGYTVTRRRIWTYEYSDRELQERTCKYVAGNTPSIETTSPGGLTGPNADCALSLLPLTDVKASVLSKINAMQSVGGTNIHQGAMWGFHMLSPTEPLTGASSYDSATSKVMILMTDGENTHSFDNDGVNNKADWYTAYGYPANGRLDGDSTSELQTEMNARTVATCTNAKAANIVIYTIGLNSPNAATTQMLEDCASGPEKSHFPNSSSELIDVFREIAEELSKLRLAM